MSAPATGATFDYAVVRVVPRVERDEFVNVGVIVFCKARGYLAARIELDRARLLALWPGLAEGSTLDELAAALAAVEKIAAGDQAAGPIAALPQSERFHWLTAPKSAMTQVSPVHTGLCDDPAAALARLVEKYVRVG